MGLVALPATAAADVSIGVVEDDGTVGDNRVTAQVRPGDRLARRIQVGNTGDDPIHVELYPAAATVVEGRFVFGDGRRQNELSRWITVRPASFELPPRTGGRATLAVNIPADAAPGARRAMVWAELPGSGGPTGVVSRIGIRVHLTVEAPRPDRDDPPDRPVVAVAAAALLIGGVVIAGVRLRRR